MTLSSAGANSRDPPHTIQPLVFSITNFVCSVVRLTGMRVSALSAVPLAEVIAREVFGIVNPAAAIKGTTRSVVLSPGTPPMECLSHIGLFAISDFFPVPTIASVRLVAYSIPNPDDQGQLRKLQFRIHIDFHLQHLLLFKNPE